jgi:hypothetical protein
MQAARTTQAPTTATAEATAKTAENNQKLQRQHSRSIKTPQRRKN